MTAKNDDARLLLHQEKKSLEIILTVFKSYLELDIKVSCCQIKQNQNSYRKVTFWDIKYIVVVTLKFKQSGFTS